MTYAEAYDQCFKDRLSDLTIIQKFIASFPEHSVLAELGAGSGRIAAKIERPLLLIETDSSMIRILEDRISSERLPHKVVHRSSFQLPFDDESLDGLYMTANTLAEMMPLTFTLSEIARVLKKGGRLYFLNENPADLDQRKPAFLRPVEGDSEDLYRISTRRSPYFGPHVYQTLFAFDDETGTHPFNILQTLPRYEDLIRLLKLAGFRIDHIFGDLNGQVEADSQSQFFNVFCTKESAANLAPVFPGLDGFFTQMAQQYEAVAENSRYALPERLLQWTSSQKTPRFRTLDLGCANGFIGSVLRQAQYNWRFFGIDLNSSMVQACRQSGTYEATFAADLNQGLPILENEFFDRVICFGVSEFIKSGEALMKEIARVLFPDGEAYISFECSTSDSLPNGKIQPNGIVKFHYSKEEADHLIHQANFEAVHYERVEAYLSPTSNHWIPYHLYKVKRR